MISAISGKPRYAKVANSPTSGMPKLAHKRIEMDRMLKLIQLCAWELSNTQTHNCLGKTTLFAKSSDDTHEGGIVTARCYSRSYVVLRCPMPSWSPSLVLTCSFVHQYNIWWSWAARLKPSSPVKLDSQLESDCNHRVSNIYITYIYICVCVCLVPPLPFFLVDIRPRRCVHETLCLKILHGAAKTKRSLDVML